MQNSSVAVSVLLPIYKEPLHWIDEAISSILQQTFRDFELLLLLDNPDDVNLISFLNNFKENKKVRLIINEKNLGLAKTLNRGIKSAKGKYIARLDADDIALPSRLKQQHLFMEANQQIDLCGSRVLKISAEGHPLSTSSQIVNYEILKRIIPYKNIITHSTWFIKKAAYLNVGLYRNFPNVEDYDLVARLFDAGYQISIIDKVLVILRTHNHGYTGAQSLNQKICFKYIQRLRQERLQAGKDSFNENYLANLILRKEKKYSVQQEKAQISLLNFFHAKTKGKYIDALYYLSVSFLLSPIQRAYYLDWLKAEFISQKFLVPYNLLSFLRKRVTWVSSIIRRND